MAVRTAFFDWVNTIQKQELTLVMTDWRPKSSNGDSQDSEPLADPRVQRVVNLLGQIGWRKRECARRLRTLAEWYQPSGMRACEECGELFKPQRRTARYCSTACRKVAYRRNSVP